MAKNSLRLLGGPFPSPQTPYPYRTSLRSVRPVRPWPAIVWPDFTNKVRPAEASGLRPSALASRPPTLVTRLYWHGQTVRAHAQTSEKYSTIQYILDVIVMLRWQNMMIFRVGVHQELLMLQHSCFTCICNLKNHIDNLT